MPGAYAMGRKAAPTISAVLRTFEPGQLVTQLHHFPHNHQGRRMHLMLGHQVWQVRQGAGEHALITRGPLLHQRRRGTRGAPVANQLGTDGRQAHQAHVEHQGLP